MEGKSDWKGRYSQIMEGFMEILAKDTLPYLCFLNNNFGNSVEDEI